MLVVSMLVVSEPYRAQHHYFKPLKQSAHAFERTGTEKPAPISMGPSFFHDAEGQDDSETDEDENESARSGDESQDSNRDEQHDNSDRDSVASSDSYRSHNPSDTDRSSDSD